MTVLPILVRLRIVGTRHDSRSERSLSVFFFFFVQHGVINRRRRVRLKRTLRAHTAATVSFVFALFFFASDPARTVAFCPERIVFLQPFSCNHGRSGVHTKPTSPVIVPPTSRPRPANRENPRSPLPPISVRRRGDRPTSGKRAKSRVDLPDSRSPRIRGDSAGDLPRLDRRGPKSTPRRRRAQSLRCGRPWRIARPTRRGRAVAGGFTVRPGPLPTARFKDVLPSRRVRFARKPSDRLTNSVSKRSVSRGLAACMFSRRGVNGDYADRGHDSRETAPGVDGADQTTSGRASFDVCGFWFFNR